MYNTYYVITDPKGACLHLSQRTVGTKRADRKISGRNFMACIRKLAETHLSKKLLSSNLCRRMKGTGSFVS